MQLITPVVHELHLSHPERMNKWKFKKAMKHEFANNPMGRIWWVNTNTKIKTSIHDMTSHTDDGAPPGLKVFAPLASSSELKKVVLDLQNFFQEEVSKPTVPFYDMCPYNRFRCLFDSTDAADTPMKPSAVIEVLQKRAPMAAALAVKFSKSIMNLLQISQERFDNNAFITVIKYSPGAGIQTHIDNLGRLGGTEGPVFTMSLGGSSHKIFDMFPVIEHWRTPKRITTPTGSIICVDGVSRIEWSHGIPEDDPTVRWTIMIKFRQISTKIAKYSDVLDMNIYESAIHPDQDPSLSGDEESTDELSLLLARLGVFVN